MSQTFTVSEVKLNNGKNGSPTWIIIKDSVYDVTSYLNEHPGGPELVEEWAGKDATKAFNNAGHSSDANRMLKKYKIGEVAKETILSSTVHTVKEYAKDKKEKRRIKLFFCI